jgi:hypothetical protein
VARSVKILQVQCVIPHLVLVCDPKSMLADLELDHDHRGPGDQNRIDPAADSRDIEFKEDRAHALAEGGFEHGDLAKPSVPL